MGTDSDLSSEEEANGEDHSDDVDSEDLDLELDGERSKLEDQQDFVHF